MTGASHTDLLPAGGCFLARPFCSLPLLPGDKWTAVNESTGAMLPRGFRANHILIFLVSSVSLFQYISGEIAHLPVSVTMFSLCGSVWLQCRGRYSPPQSPACERVV